MEINTTNQIVSDKVVTEGQSLIKIKYKEPLDKEWVALDQEVKEAISLYLHLKNHTEVKSAEQYRGMPCCKICNKSAYQIMCKEWKINTQNKKVKR